MHTREEKLFVSMQQRLQQAAINDRERRTLLAQLESREEAQKVLVREHLLVYMDAQCCGFCVHRETLLSLILLVLGPLGQLPRYMLCVVYRF